MKVIELLVEGKVSIDEYGFETALNEKPNRIYVV